jgi:hypothetical protein
VRSSKKINVYLCQKLPFVLACFQASAAPRLENSDSDEKDALFTVHIFWDNIQMYFLLSFPLKQYTFLWIFVDFGGASDFQNRLLNKIEKFFKFLFFEIWWITFATTKEALYF